VLFCIGTARISILSGLQQQRIAIVNEHADHS
jgi:hypothetical protein